MNDNQKTSLNENIDENLQNTKDEALSVEENLKSADEILETKTNPIDDEILQNEKTIVTNKTSKSGLKLKTKNNKKKHGILYKIIMALLLIVLVLLLPILGFLLYSSIDGANPIEYIPDGHYAYISIDNAGDLLQKTLSMHTLDSVLSTPETAKLQGLIRSFRASPMLSSWWFKIASNIRLDIAAYSENNFLLFGKLGFRSAGTRLLPLVLKFNPDLFLQVKELVKAEENGLEFWKYSIDKNQTFYIGTYRDSLIISSSEELFFSAFVKKNEDEHIKLLGKFIKESKKENLRILSDINYFTKNAPNDKSIYNNFLNSIKFANNGRTSLNLDYDDISIRGLYKWSTESEGLKKILQKENFVPGILNRLPKSTDYVTLINIGDPEFIFQNGKDILGSSVLQNYNTANKTSKFMFNKTIGELLFSWMGEEMGAFGVNQSDIPVFFVSLKDEKQCRAAFELIYSSFFVNRNISALVDGLRIPRIEFPNILTNLLRAFKVELPTPFYVIDGGYLYLSQSAEALAATVNDVKAGNLLVKTENWKKITKTISPETSFFVYYTLEKQIPFFLKNNDVLKAILKDYGRGLLSLRFDKNDEMKLELYTEKTEAHSLGELASFPYNCNVKLNSHIYCGKNTNNVPFAYWTGGQNLYALNLADKTLKSIKLDDKAYLNLEIKKGIIEAVWAISTRGTIYRTDYALTVFSGFPILTGEKLGAPPTVIQDKIAIPIANKPAILYVDSSASAYYSDEMNTKLRTSPMIFENLLASIPRSFSSFIYLFDIDGKILSGYPKELDAISAVQPVLYRNSDNLLCTAILTEEGTFSLKVSDSSKEKESDEYKIELNTSCKTQPVYSNNLKMFFLITDNGFLYKIDTECNIIDKTALKQKNASDYLITLMDLDSDGYDDVLVSGGGNSIYAYNANFLPLDGFPVSGTGIPYLLDVDGNSSFELITCGIDNYIHSYTGVSK